MKKHLLTILIPAVLITSLILGLPVCAAQTAAPLAAVTSVNTASTESDPASAFSGRRIAVTTGSIFDSIALKYIPDCIVSYINSSTDMALALETGKIDAYIADEPIARLLMQNYPMQHIAWSLESAEYGYIFPKDSEHSENIRLEISAFIDELWEDGTIAELDEKWFGLNEEIQAVEYPEYSSDHDTVRLAVTTEVGAPFVYYRDGVLVGYDVEIVALFCRSRGYNLEIEDYSLSGMLAAVAGGRCDLAGSTINLTEERAEVFNFSSPNYHGGIVLVSRDADLNVISAVSDASIFEKLRGNTIGVVSGSICGEEAMKKIPDCQILTYNSVADMVTALETGKIDAYCADQPLVRGLLPSCPNHTIYAVVSHSDNAFIYPKDSLKSSLLCAQMNGFLEKIRADGTYGEITSLWFDETDESLRVVDMSGLTGENGTLKFGSSTMVGSPNCYLKDGVYAGFDVDLAVRFCREYGYGIEIVDYSFGGLLDAVSAGKADFGGACITVTEERKERMLFSDASYNGGNVIVIRGTTPVVRSEEGVLLTVRRFFEKVAESFAKTMIREQRWKLFLSGIYVTLLITVLSALFGTLLGFLLYLLYRKKNRFFCGLTRVISDILGKTPVVLLLMVLYYIIFVNSTLSGIAVSVIGFTLLFCFSVNELLATAESAVPKIQKEVSLALGYTNTNGYIKVLLPQTWSIFLPGYQTEIVNLVKATAIVGYIAVQDLTKVSDIIRSRTYDAFFPLILSALTYFLIAWLLTFLIRFIARQMGKFRKGKSPVHREASK